VYKRILNAANEQLKTTQISKRSRGQIYKISATLRYSLEHRFKREGYVEGIEAHAKGSKIATRMDCLSKSLLIIQYPF
jgi:hypothetical protein